MSTSKPASSAKLIEQHDIEAAARELGQEIDIRFLESDIKAQQALCAKVWRESLLSLGRKLANGKTEQADVHVQGFGARAGYTD